MASRRKIADEACAGVARAAFGHVSEARKRREVEEALKALVDAIESMLGDIAQAIGDDIGEIEQRVAGLEKDSHPPVALRPIVIEEVAAAVKRAVHRPRVV